MRRTRIPEGDDWRDHALPCPNCGQPVMHEDAHFVAASAIDPAWYDCDRAGTMTVLDRHPRSTKEADMKLLIDEDVVKGLEHTAHNLGINRHGLGTGIEKQLRDAAALLRRMKQENERLEADRDEAWDDCGRAHDEIKTLAARLQAQAKEIERLTELRATENVLAEGHIARLALEVERLRVAIKPFADVADALDFYVEEAMPSEESLCFPRGDVRVRPDECGHKLISFDDFRAARASLERQTP